MVAIKLEGFRFGFCLKCRDVCVWVSLKNHIIFLYIVIYLWGNQLVLHLDLCNVLSGAGCVFFLSCDNHTSMIFYFEAGFGGRASELEMEQKKMKIS